MARLRHRGLLVLLAILVIGAWAGGLRDYASFAVVGREQAALRAFVQMQPVVAPLAYVLIYAAGVTVSLPIGALMSVTGGLLFGLVPGTVLAVAGASLGATGVFLLARFVAGDRLAQRVGALMDRVRPRLQRDGFSYLLALRLLPVVPFWLTNLASALAGMRLTPYAAATVLGITPGTAVFVSLGAGLGDTLAAGRRPDLGVVFGPAVLLPLLALAALALAPVMWRAWQRRGSHA